MGSTQWAIGRTAWKTRGRHWDYDFISTPTSPQLAAWSSVVGEILEHEDPRAAQLVYGTLSAEEDGSFAFAAARFHDPVRQDWTGRPIQHFIVWFPTDMNVEDIPARLPGDWHLQALGALAGTYGREDVFGTAEEKLLEMRREGASHATEVTATVKTTPPVRLSGNPADESAWVRRDVEKKKSPSATLPSRPQANPRARPSFPTPLWIALLALGLLVLWSIMKR